MVRRRVRRCLRCDGLGQRTETIEVIRGRTRRPPLHGTTHRSDGVYHDGQVREYGVVVFRQEVSCSPGSVARRRIRIHWGLFFLLLFSGALGASAQDASPGDQPNGIHGTVINAVTGAPIARALVHSLDDRFAVFTDSSGQFEFSLAKAPTSLQGDTTLYGSPAATLVRGSDGTTLLLEARKPGFLEIAGGAPVASSSRGEVTIPLVPEAVIQGRITLSTGEPALGLTVELLKQQARDGLTHWDAISNQQANSEGEFRFAELPAGAYKIVTRELLDNDPVATVPGQQMYGFAPVFYPGVADMGAAETIQLSAGQNFQADLSLTHQPYYPVKISVAESDVMAAMNVQIWLQGKKGPGYSLGYNPERHAIEGLLPNGNYLVQASRFGPGTGETGTVNLRVAGSATESPAMPLVRNSSITFEVKEEFSNTEKNTQTAVYNAGNRPTKIAGPRAYLNIGFEPAEDFGNTMGVMQRPPAGAEDGSLVFENAAPGRYFLRFYPARGYVAAATAGGVDLLHQALVVEGGSNVPVEVVMRDDFAEVDGTVGGGGSSGESATNSRTSATWIYCVPLPDSSGQAQQIQTDSEGHFGPLPLAPGTYRIMAFAKQTGEIPFRDAEAMKAYEGKGQVIQLTGGQKASVQLQVISGQ